MRDANAASHWLGANQESSLYVQEQPVYFHFYKCIYVAGRVQRVCVQRSGGATPSSYQRGPAGVVPCHRSRHTGTGGHRPGTLRSRYLAVSFLQRTHKRCPIARPLRASYGASFVSSLNKVWAFFLSHCVPYRVTFNCDVSRVCSIRPVEVYSVVPL